MKFGAGNCSSANDRSLPRHGSRGGGGGGGADSLARGAVCTGCPLNSYSAPLVDVSFLDKVMSAVFPRRHSQQEGGQEERGTRTSGQTRPTADDNNRRWDAEAALLVLINHS